MDENGRNLSVFKLVTQLCEKTLEVNDVPVRDSVVKNLRSKAYAILLNKVATRDAPPNCLLETKDPYSELIAWQYVLLTEHNLKEHSERIEACVETLRKSMDGEVLKSVLSMLVQLKGLPKKDTSLWSSNVESEGSNCFFKVFDTKSFEMPNPFICANAKYSDESFQFPRKYTKVIGSKPHVSKMKSCRNYKNIEYNCSPEKLDEGYESVNQSDVSYEVWDDIICKAEYTNRRTWETLGDPKPEIELPFPCESSPETSSLLFDIQKIFANRLSGEVYQPTHFITEKEFIRDIKFIMVGVTSQTFIKVENEKIIMKPGISIKGVTSSMLQYYSRNAIFCGATYTALNDMIAIDPSTGNRKQKGFMFAEFCNSIKKYLLFYRLAATSLSDSMGLLKHSNRMQKLYKQLHMLSSVCKVGAFHESEQIPDGVALLNYLYNKVLGLSNNDVAMVLYSILYPCLQVYFNRFLRQWILEGTVNDPHEEFFIKPDNKYLKTRGRTYWTRGYNICEGIVPVFLAHLSTDILNCGKTMSLLKLCAPSSPTSKYLTGTKPNILQCCFTSQQLSRLENEVRCYYLEVIAEGGPRLCMDNLISQSREDKQIFLTMVAVKRAATLKKIETEKLKKIKTAVDKKLEAMKALKEQYDQAMLQKEVSRLTELEIEMTENENLLKMKKLEERIIQEESAKMIEYYKNLFEESDRRAQSINKHMETIKSIQLDDKHEEPRKTIDQSKPSEQAQQPLDVINANTEKPPEEITNFEQALLNKQKVLGSEMEYGSQNGKSVREESKTVGGELTEAQRNKLKVMRAEMGINLRDEGEKNEGGVQKNVVKTLTDAQKNKLKVLTEEMGMDYEKEESQNVKIDAPLTEAQKNKLKVMSVEMGIDHANERTDNRVDVVLTEARRNKLKVMGADCEKDTEIQSPARVLTEAMMEAKRNRIKIMNIETGLSNEVKAVKTSELTAAQKNKLKVMSSEFGLITEFPERNLNRQLSNMEINRNKNMATNECFYNAICDDVNDNFIKDKKETNEMIMSTCSDELNDNVILPVDDTMKRYSNLKLDFKKLKKTREEHLNKINFQSGSVFEKFMKSPHFEFSKPMSVDSTPMTEFSPLPSLPDRFSHLETLSTACSNFTDEGFQFPQEKAPPTRHPTDPTTITHITKAEIDNIYCLNYFVKQSISIPIMAQIDLLQNDLLKYVIKDLHFIDHLISLRNYFFLLDGEFARNITEGLFEKLYEVDSPKDLINNNTLSHLVRNAVEFSSKYNENSKYLSFKILSLPKEFDLTSNKVLECISLTYKMQWPLNVLVPSDSIAKYDEVFKFLLKLHRVSWILKKIFMEMKLLAKRCGKKSAYLMLSPHYQKLQHYRHIMTHFVTTFQAYIVGEVLQNSWASFEENLKFVTNMDQLHYIHRVYIRNIFFMCLLNQRSAPVRKVIDNIFDLILKFYNFLRLRHWEFEENQFTHPRMQRLDSIFTNFIDFVRFLFKAGRKFVRVGYQPQLAQFVDMLDINDYYSKNTKTETHR